MLVKHEDIPGFMPAMTMPYAVNDAALLKDRAAGDLITATLNVGAGTARTCRRSTRPAPRRFRMMRATTIPAAAGVHILQPGDTRSRYDR